MAETPSQRPARASFASHADVDEFVATLERFERGEISAEAWRKFRLVRGTYAQRQDDVQMLRVKIPQGILTASQLRTLAHVAERHARGFAHVTTRQNIQFHFLQLADVETIMRLLVDEGVTTREACGNSVRNITACPFAGVSADEVFDVTPYAEALTRYLLGHPLAAILPRKFKIAFEGCAEDHAFASINDLGYHARIEEQGGQPVRGFRLTVGGGTSIMPVTGRVLFEFLPAAEIFNAAEAIIRVYHRLGDHEHRQRNRMKFLIKTLGWDRWRDEVLATLAEVRAGSDVALTPDRVVADVASIPESAPDWSRAALPSLDEVIATVAATPVTGPGLHPPVVPSRGDDAARRAWLQTNIKPQRQTGYAIALVRLILGDISAGQLRVLSSLAEACGDGTVRLTPDQNVFLRWVPDALVPDLFARLAAAGLGEPGASTIADVTSCPGAESCRLAVTQSRGLGRVLTETLASHPELTQVAASASVKISGCPNGCGQHHVATLGFQGSVRKVNGRAVPQYFVMIGGSTSGGSARFARLAAKIPARRVGVAVTRLLEWYRRDRLEGELPDAFFGRVAAPDVKKLLADLESFTPEDAPPEDYVDLGETQAFTPDVLEGECAT